MADENNEIQEQQTEVTPQQQGIQFEDILPWGTTGGDTGLSSRLKLKRNFEKIKAWMDSLQINVSAEDKLSRTEDDEAAGLIGFLKGIWVGVKEKFGWTADGDITARNIKGEKLEVERFEAEKLAAAEAVINEIRSDNYNGSGLGDEGFIVTNSHNGHSYIEVDELFVRMKAVFAELEVRKESYTGGNQHLGPAGSILYRVDYLTDSDDVLGYTEAVVPWLLKGMPFLLNIAQGLGLVSYASRRLIRVSLSEEEWRRVSKFRCYFVADDGTTRTRNWWKVGDQARCQTFNIESREAREYEVAHDEAQIEQRGGMAGNIFYWRTVVATGTAQLDDGRFYDYVDLSNINTPETRGYVEGSDIPAAGDSIVCWGSRHKTGRMGLISFETQGDDDDTSGQTPAIKMYAGINSFSMNNKRTMLLSPGAVELSASTFKWITRDGSLVPNVVDRGMWEEGKKYFYYDRVNWAGCIWLCVIEDIFFWESMTETETVGEGDDAYERPKRYDHNKAQLDDGQDGFDGSIGHLNGYPDRKVVLTRNYTYVEPSEDAERKGIWLKQVNRGVTITETRVSYAADSQGITPPANLAQNWFETIALLEQAKGGHLGDPGLEFLWTRRVTSYSDNMQPTYEYFVSRFGSVVTGSKVEFAVTTEVMSMPADDARVTWYDDFEDVAAQAVGNAYIWTRHTVTYQDGKTTVSYQVTRVGNGVSAVEELYCTGTSPTTNPDSTFKVQDGKVTYNKLLWSEQRPAYDANSGKIYLWNFELTSFSDGTQTASTPHCIANLGRGVEGIKEYYALSKQDGSGLAGQYGFPSDIYIPDASWRSKYRGCEGRTVKVNDPGTWEDEKADRTPTDTYPYQWNMTVVEYNTKDDDGSFVEVFYHISSSKGTPGKSYNGFQEYYKLSNSGTTAPTFDPNNPTNNGWSDGVIPAYTGGANKYLWNAEVSEVITPAFGATAAQSRKTTYIGCIGDFSRSIQSITEEYGRSTSGEAKSDGTPKVMPDSWTKVENNLTLDETYRYMWNRTTVKYTDGSADSVTYHVCLIKSVDVKGIEEYFKRTNSQTSYGGGYTADQRPDSTWTKSTAPNYANDGKLWLWNMEVTVLDDGTLSTTPPHCIGNFANGIKSVTDYYMLSTDGINHPAANSTSWSTTMPSVERDKFLWNKEVVKFTDGNMADAVTYHVIALYAADGMDAPLAVLSDTIVSVPCNTEGKVFGGAFSERIDIDLLLNGVADIQPKTVSISGDSKGYVSIKNNNSQNNVYLQVSIADQTALTEETIKVDITGYDSTKTKQVDGTEIYEERKGTAYFHIRKWVSGDGYLMQFTDPMAASATAPTVSTWSSFTWRDNPSGQVSEEKQCIYVAMWRTTVDGTKKTTAPYYVGLYDHFGKDGRSVMVVAKYYFASSSATYPTYNENTWKTKLSDLATPWNATNKYLYAIEKTQWSDGSTEWGDVYLVSVWGTNGNNGDPGKDGLTVKINPQVLIYNQDTTAAATFASATNGPRAEVRIYRDGTEVSFTAGTAKAYGTNSSGTSSEMSGKAGYNSSNHMLYLTGVTTSSTANGEYTYAYDHGYIELPITVESKNYTLQVAWYLNRLGNRETVIKGDFKGEYMSKTEYALSDSADNLLKNTQNPSSYTTSSGSATAGDGKWFVDSGGNGSGSIETVSDSPVKGYKAFRISNNTNGGNRNWSQKWSFWKKTDIYRFSAYVRGIGGTVNAHIRVWQHNEDGRFEKTISVGTEWKFISLVVTIPNYNESSTNPASMYFGINGNGSIEYVAPCLVRTNDTAVIRTDYEGKIESKASGLRTEFTTSINGVKRDVSSVEQAANSLTAKVSGLNIENLMKGATNGNGWLRYYISGSTFYSVAALFDNTNGAFGSNNNTYKTICSPSIYLEEGKTYTLTYFSEFGTSAFSAVKYSQTQSAQSTIAVTGTAVSVSKGSISDKYGDVSGYYVRFTAPKTGYYLFIWADSEYQTELFFCPMLVEGSTACVSSTAIISMSSKSISLKVQSGLSNTNTKLSATGIDIENKKITLTADNLVCKNNSGVSTLYLDNAGNLTIIGKLKTATYDYKCYAYGSPHYNYIPNDADYYQATTSNNNTVILPDPQYVKGKRLTVYNPTSRAYADRAQLKVSSAGSKTIIQYFSTSGGSQELEIGHYKFVVFWSDPNISAGAWRIIEAYEY